MGQLLLLMLMQKAQRLLLPEQLHTALPLLCDGQQSLVASAAADMAVQSYHRGK
jgi:hypothetical protein